MSSRWQLCWVRSAVPGRDDRPTLRHLLLELAPAISRSLRLPDACRLQHPRQSPTEQNSNIDASMPQPVSSLQNPSWQRMEICPSSMFFGGTFADSLISSATAEW